MNSIFLLVFALHAHTHTAVKILTSNFRFVPASRESLNRLPCMFAETVPVPGPGSPGIVYFSVQFTTLRRMLFSLFL